MTTKPEGYDLTQTVDELLRFGSEQLRSISRFRLVGYGLLLLAFFDFIYMFVPSNFGNPAWEFQTLGLLVERVPVPLLGLALIFFGENYERRRWEGLFLKLLSWVTLAIAIFFLVLVPVGITRTLQINNQNNTQIAAQAAQQTKQLQQVETQLQSGSKEDIQTVALQLNSLGIPVDTQNPDKLKSELLSRIAEAKQQLPVNQAKAKSDQFLLLLKDAAKWNLGALISSLLFARIWQTTRWARRGNR